MINSIIIILASIIFSAFLCNGENYQNIALRSSNITHSQLTYNQNFPSLGQSNYRHKLNTNDNSDIVNLSHNVKIANDNHQSVVQNNNRNNFNNYNQHNGSPGNVWNSQSNTGRINNNQHTPQTGYVRSQINKWNSYLNNTGNNIGPSNENNNQQTSNKNGHNPYVQQQSVIQNKLNAEVTDDELREFSEKLLEKDNNNAAKYVTLHLQSKTSSRSTNDEAPLPLMSIDSKAFNIPTIAKLSPLYDNYIVQSSMNEDYTNHEKNEENAFLNSIINTDVMMDAKKFLLEKGVINHNDNFKNLLHDIWFNMYSREKGKVGSSGFEHVFLGEIKNNKVSGLHNWIYFDREERNNRANYLGYLKKIDLGDKGAILKYSFKFYNIHKPVGGMFIGTSPEFEMALYSVCFLLRADKICPLKLNGHRFVIRTFTFTYNRKKLIGSAFPEI